MITKQNTTSLVQLKKYRNLGPSKQIKICIYNKSGLNPCRTILYYLKLNLLHSAFVTTMSLYFRASLNKTICTTTKPVHNSSC